MSRLAIISRSKCKSNDCGSVCIKYCPVNLMDYKCIELDDKKIAVISESLCTGCGICIKKCDPWDAIMIINLPVELDRDITHRYGPNSFKLHRLPIPRNNKIIGLVGQNGSGKSTSLKILTGEIQPNLGLFDDETPDWDGILNKFKGSELLNLFKKLLDKSLKVSIKPQAVDKLPKIIEGVVSDLIKSVDTRGVIEELKETFSLQKIWDRKVSVLSGGELQRLAIAAAIAKDADLYLIDEPTSYLDIKERIKIAAEIRKLGQTKMVIVVEHDLAILDYLSDQVQIFYGKSGAYGVVTTPMSVREGINAFLEGYIPSENMRFRDEPLKFSRNILSTQNLERYYPLVKYGHILKKYDTFEVKIQNGELYPSEIVGIIGPNGIGKTTFAKVISGYVKPTELEGEIKLLRKRVTEDEDDNDDEFSENLKLTISYKPQYIELEEKISVRELLNKANPIVTSSGFFTTELIKPLGIGSLLNSDVSTLSGGELQRVSIAACLAKDADLYLIDEPSAFISAEDRIKLAKTIRRLIMHRRAAGIVIEHDLMLQAYISDKIIHFNGESGISGFASEPMSVKDGMNAFLKEQNVTFRNDHSTGRPRINKLDSKLDKEQKASGNYYIV